jgi:hypothetical protein
MAYTQQLFDSLRRSRAPPPAASEPYEASGSLATPLARSRYGATATPAAAAGAPPAEDLHGALALQKSQLAQLRARLETLDEQAAQVRLSVWGGRRRARWACAARGLPRARAARQRAPKGPPEHPGLPH